MSSPIVVGFDDSDVAKAALNFALGQCKAQGAALIIAHVLEWSPYSFLTPEELEERHKRRRQELERANEALIAPTLKSLEQSGVEARAVVKYGHIAETLCAIAKEAGASQIVVGRIGDSSFSSRLFGSVAGSLAQAAPVPVTIVP